MTGPGLALYSVGVRVRVRVRVTEVGVGSGTTLSLMAISDQLWQPQLVPGPVMTATTGPPDHLIRVDERFVAVEGVALQCFFISFSFADFLLKDDKSFGGN